MKLSGSPEGSPRAPEQPIAARIELLERGLAEQRASLRELLIREPHLGESPDLRQIALRMTTLQQEIQELTREAASAASPTPPATSSPSPAPQGSTPDARHTPSID